MRYLHKFFDLILQMAVPVKFRERFILAVMSAFKKNPLHFAYSQLGILKYQNLKVSGELFVLTKVLPSLLPMPCSNTVMFDIGANKGEYTRVLCEQFPLARVYSFEPNHNTYTLLLESVKYSNVKFFNFGFSDEDGQVDLFAYREDISTSHASIYGDVLTDIHHSDSVERISILLKKLDNFCEENHIGIIDFLKIDTEGNELKVLNGASSLLRSGAIKIIQFEFNEMNVISRVFFKDFYELLGSNYNLYRIDTDRLLPIRKYDAIYEIFKFQNILAVQKHIGKWKHQ